MRMRLAALVPVALVVLLGVVSAPAAALCEPDGDVQFLCGPVSPEDLALIPDTGWVIISSWDAHGYLSVADSTELRAIRLFPTGTARSRHATGTYGACPGMSTDGFHPHGISLRRGSDGRHELYVVRHGAREAVEVFEIDARGPTPRLTWIGCVVAPEELRLNAVVALPEGGFAVTSPRTNDLWEWHPETGWVRVPGSDDIGPNGIEVSPDGAWLYVGGYGSQSLIRLSRGRKPVQKQAIELGFHVDNLHWAPDGTLLSAGHTAPTPGRVRECIVQNFCDGIVSRVVKVDAALTRIQELFTYPSNEYLPLGTVALQVGEEIWIGAVGGGERIARIPAR